MSYNLVDWIDVSLDEFEFEDTNMNPPDPELSKTQDPEPAR